MKNKNIWLLPTDKPSKLYFNHNKGFEKYQFSKEPFINGLTNTTNQHIYITSSDEKPNDGDYGLIGNDIGKIILTEDGYEFLIGIGVSYTYGDLHSLKKVCKKIILTDNEDLIKDGVQKIDDEFLEWFVKNPSCEEIKINYEIYKEGVGLLTSDWRMSEDDKYKIIIPKEEPKQETLEELALDYSGCEEHRMDFIAGFKACEEQNKNLYSEEDVLKILLARNAELGIIEKTEKVIQFIEQFKKK